MFLKYSDYLDLISADLNPIRKIINDNNISFRDYLNSLDETAESSKSIFLLKFDSNGGDVKILSECCKPGIPEHRANLVLKQLNRISKLASFPDLCIGYEFDDIAPTTGIIPIFSYRKREDSISTILVPDFELYEFNYYSETIYQDKFCFDDKLNRAIFVGSTTGTNKREDRDYTNTIKNIDNDPSIRIEAAKFFNNSNVVFRLPNIVQCDTQETVDYLRTFDFTNPRRIGWQEQFSYKFIISIDGNGPTISRVAITLLSNSILIKYRSRWLAYYHRAMQPGIDYIDISDHEEILYYLDGNALPKENLKEISRNSSEKFSLLLQRSSVERYFATVLNEFRSIFFGADESYIYNRKKIDSVSHFDIDAHFSNIGDVSFWPSLNVYLNGAFIEGITIYPSSSLFKWHNISYQVMFKDGSVSSVAFGGTFCGSRGENKEIIGFRIRAISKELFSLDYEGEFEDGTVVSAHNGEWIANSHYRLIRISFRIFVS